MLIEPLGQRRVQRAVTDLFDERRGLGEGATPSSSASIRTQARHWAVAPGTFAIDDVIVLAAAHGVVAERNEDEVALVAAVQLVVGHRCARGGLRRADLAARRAAA